MLNTYSMMEYSVFNRVVEYLKDEGWEDVSIAKTILDDGDVSFNIYLKCCGRTYLKPVSRTDFESLLMLSSKNASIVKITPYQEGINYEFSPNTEERVHR